MATLVVVGIHTKCRSAANLEHNFYVKFEIIFSIGLEIPVSRENLGGQEFFS